MVGVLVVRGAITTGLFATSPRGARRTTVGFPLQSLADPDSYPDINYCLVSWPYFLISLATPTEFSSPLFSNSEIMLW
jgi:hypothetical protein